MQSYLALLRRRPGFRYLWLASLISLAGDWFNAVATVMLVNRYANSGLAVSALFLARYLPPFFAGPIAGVLADRFNRKWILIASDLLRALIVLGFLLVNSLEQVWLVYVLTVAQFILSAFFEPARAAVLPELVEQDELVATNTLAGITYSAMLVLGAAIGGVVAATFGTHVALVIDAASFLASTALLSRIAVAGPAPRAHGAASSWRDLVAGLQLARHQPGVGAIVMVKGFGQWGSVDVIAATLAATTFSLGQNGGGSLGLMLAAMGVGTLLGPPLGNLFHRGAPDSLRRMITVGFAVIAVSWLFIGASPWFALALAAFCLRGIGGGINWIYSDILIQMSVPNQFRGRIFSLNLAFFTLVVSISTLMTGYLLDRPTVDARQLSIWIGFVSLIPLVLWLGVMRKKAPELNVNGLHGATAVTSPFLESVSQEKENEG